VAASSRQRAALTEVTHYVIEVGTAAGMTDVGSFAVDGTSVVVPHAPPGSYYVTVRGVSGTGMTAPSNIVVVIVP
jgi:hypothetical protein